jgi:hypothetical protein
MAPLVVTRWSPWQPTPHFQRPSRFLEHTTPAHELRRPRCGICTYTTGRSNIGIAHLRTSGEQCSEFGCVFLRRPGPQKIVWSSEDNSGISGNWKGGAIAPD